MVYTKYSLLCACAAVLSNCYGRINHAESDAHGTVRRVADAGHIELPKTFTPGTVVDVATDVIAATIDEFEIATGMITGSSIVYTFDVTVAGEYEVSYGLAGFPPVGQEETLVMGFSKGRVTCPPAGDEGVIGVEAFTTGNWDKPVNYLGTKINLAAGVGQEYTLCFARAAYVNLNYICIGTKCSAMAGTVDAGVVIEEEVVAMPAVADMCEQNEVPVGAKEGSCVQVLCAPEFVSLGTPFHMIVRFCNTHPRKWDLSLNILDDALKTYVENIGTGIEYNYHLAMELETTQSPTPTPTMAPTMAPSFSQDATGGEEGTQCGDYTFEITLDPDTVDKEAVLIWEFHMKPIWYTGMDETVDIFPNLIGQTSYFVPPTILPQDMSATLKDCPVMATRNFVPQNIELMDMIRFPMMPACFTPGEVFEAYVDVHVESLDQVDVRANLQIGSGADLYLGVDDVFIAESNAYGVEMSTDDQYWYRYTINYLAADTQNINPEDNLYLVVFMVQSGDVYDETQGGWNIIDREFNLLIEQCPV
jgi:hypothetical protein